MSKRVKRPYDGSRRHAQAEVTKQQIVDAAKPLFLDQGYEATSMRQLAEASGVSLQTVYNALQSKFGVFSALMDVIIAGDHEPVALADRVDFIALDAIEDPRELLRAIVRVAAPILARLDVIYPTLRAAAASDPQVAEAHQRFTLDARYEQYRSIGAKLASLGALPDGMTASAAVDILWTVLSPDTYNLLVSHRGWSREQFVAWATDCVLATVVTNRVPKKALPKKPVRKRQAN